MLTDNQEIKYVKIPNTSIIDERGYMAREWVYFFNDIGRAVDQSIQANLSEMTKTLLESADTAELSLTALPIIPKPSDRLDVVALPNLAKNSELESVDIMALALVNQLQNKLNNASKAVAMLHDELKQLRMDTQSWQLLINN